VAPSARSGILGGATAVVVAAGLLTGCVSTQTKAARLRINADRIRASQSDTRVTAANAELSVTGVAVVAAGRRAAFVVAIRNNSDRAISDLPISIGYRRKTHRPTYLNAANPEYFAAHLPVIASHRSLIWVSAPTRRLPHGTRPFAVVGRTPAVPSTSAGRLPVIHVTPGAMTDGRLKVNVQNRSSIPQYQLPVYAVAERGGRAVAAGEATVKELDGGASQTLRLALLGRAGSAAVQLAAAATIVQ
jgi:hypothetical protein